MSQFNVSAWAASSQFSASYSADNAGDQRWSSAANERWAPSGGGPHWLRADLGTAQVATWYRVDPGRAGNDPVAWTFQGTNDGTFASWTTLDTQTAQSFSAQMTRTYTFTNTTAYRYYRMNITSGSSVAELEIGDGSPHASLWEHHPGATPPLSGNFTTGVVFVVNSPVDVTHLCAVVGTTAGTWELRIRDASGSVLASASYAALSTEAGWREVSITPVTLPAGTYIAEQYGGGVRYAARSGSHAASVSFGPGNEVTVPQQGTVTFRSSTNTSRQSAGNAEPTLALGQEAIHGFRFVPAAAGSTTAAVSAALPALTSEAAGVVTVASVVAAALPSLAGSAAAVVTNDGAIAATLPALSVAVEATSDDTTFGDVAAALPALSADAEVTVTPPAGGDVIAATLPALSAAVTVDSGLSLDPWTSGAHGDALLALDAPAGVLEVTYPAAVAPPAIVEVSLQRASHQMPALTGVRAMDYPIETDVIGTPHVWVDGVDVTYFRDVPTKIAGWRQEAPFGWTSTTLTFPQVFHYEERGAGDLAWMRADAPVEIAIVTPLGERLHKFTGQLTSDDPGVGRGRTECTWGVEGVLWQADHAHHPVPARLDPTDIRTLIVGELMGTPSRRFTVTGPATGILERKRGSNNMTRWGYTSDLLAVAIREDGKQWTLEATGKSSFALALKDTTTVHWTVSAGAPGVELDLSHDHHERIDAVYASGVGPDGYAWSNLFFPDLLPYDPPDYPYANPAQNVLLGSTDAGTLTGTGVSDWQRRIRDLGYTSLAVDGVMGSADIAAVRWVQRKRGIQVDGFLGPQTWAATWNVGAVGGDLSVVRLPMAVRPEVEKYLYGANGAIVGLNPDYDPSIIRHEIDVDFGAGVTKAQGREMALRILERGIDPGVAGTIRLTTCPWEGSRWEINAGDNLLLKGFRGEDILMRVAALDADPESLTVTLTVDSEFRDAMAVMQVLDRNRESKADPARRPGNPNRRSRLDQDQVTPFEGESPAGRLPRMALYGGLWTVWPVPVSELGLIAKLRFQTSGPASRFAVALFGRPVTANQVAAKVPHPLASSNPWAAAGDSWLDAVGFIDAWGEEGQAAGYGMLGSEADGSPVTGELYDDAGVPFVSQVAPWVWVAMYAPEPCFIEGRIYPEPVQ